MNTKMKRKLVVPDGGWGWVIATAFSIYFFLVFSMLAAFGLIYKNKFKELGFTATQSSFIFSANGGFCMLCGLVNGYLLNKFGTRKIALCSGVLVMGGLILTAYSTTFLEFLTSYGIITSIGIGMGLSSYSVALNTYFDKKRDKVTGYATSLYGTGTILFPQLVSYLLANYTIKDTMIIIAAISGNTLVSGMLLQPVKWHMKVEKVPCDKVEKEEPSEKDAFFDKQPIDGGHRNSVCNDIATMHASMTSLNIHKDKLDNGYQRTESISEKESTPKRLLRIFVTTFDLNLLTNLVFLNVLIGLSIDFFVEFNFLWVIPFILIEGNLTVEQTATFMSTYAIADILFRFLAPFVSSAFKKSNRIMYMITLVLVVAARLCLLFLTDYTPLLLDAAAIGAFRGMRLVYWSLVIPECVDSKKLAAGFGLLFTFNGLCMFLGGPIIGLLRDTSGNYKSCILMLNMVSLFTVLMWTIEMVYGKIKKRREKQEYL